MDPCDVCCPTRFQLHLSPHFTFPDPKPSPFLPFGVDGFIKNPSRCYPATAKPPSEVNIRRPLIDTTNEVNEISERSIAALKAEKEELESELNKEKSQSLQLKQELVEAESKNTDLYKELQSVRGQLAAEQSRCFKLEVDVAELRQKLQAMDTLQKELEILQRQKAASEEAYAKQKQSSGGVWGWLAGTPPPVQKPNDAA